MTSSCIKQVHKFEEENELFKGLSAEQLLYSAIKGTSIEDVRYILENTDWDNPIKEKETNAESSNSHTNT